MGTFPTSIDFLTDSWCGHRLQDKEMPAWMGFGTLKVFPNTVKGASHRASLILGFHLSEASRQATLWGQMSSSRCRAQGRYPPAGAGFWKDVLQQVQGSGQMSSSRCRVLDRCPPAGAGLRTGVLQQVQGSEQVSSSRCRVLDRGPENSHLHLVYPVSSEVDAP
jgi:hypothetical protein